jgi:hypothetical protein
MREYVTKPPPVQFVNPKSRRGTSGVFAPDMARGGKARGNSEISSRLAASASNRHGQQSNL